VDSPLQKSAGSAEGIATFARAQAGFARELAEAYPSGPRRLGARATDLIGDIAQRARGAQNCAW